MLSSGKKIVIPSLWNLSKNASRNGVSGILHDKDGPTRMLRDAKANAIILTAQVMMMAILTLDLDMKYTFYRDIVPFNDNPQSFADIVFDVRGC